MGVEVNVRERIAKPLAQVFNAFIDPAQMSHYFISGASGPMRAGTTVTWEFADVGAKVDVRVIAVEQNRRIVFEGPGAGPKTQVSIAFATDDEGYTVVTVNEAPFALDEGDVKRALGQTAGWTYTLCCLKAWLQFGINLRAGLNKRITDVG